MNRYDIIWKRMESGSHEREDSLSESCWMHTQAESILCLISLWHTNE